MTPADYRHIQAWGELLHSFDYYIKDQQKKAFAEKAPANAIYRRDDRWMTYDDIISEETKNLMDKLLKDLASTAWVCSICNKYITDDRWGNNAWPINSGKCCRECNATRVIPARIANI